MEEERFGRYGSCNFGIFWWMVYTADPGGFAWVADTCRLWDFTDSIFADSAVSDLEAAGSGIGIGAGNLVAVGDMPMVKGACHPGL